MKKGRKLSDRSLRILYAIIDGGVFAVKDIIQDYIHTYEYDSRYGNYSPYQTVHNLHRKGYVKIVKKKTAEGKNISFFHLTPKGKWSILKYAHLEKIRRHKWDGHWRVIIFDVPEKIRKYREYLRSELKNLGFHPLQESVYITPYPVTGELDELLKEWGMRKYFRYLTVAEIDGSSELKSIFDLK